MIRIMRTHRSVLVLLGLFLLLVAPAPADGTILKGLSLEDLCRRSPSILRGKVVRTQPSWHNRRIYTQVTVTVTAALRGGHQPGAEVSFWTLGGVVGGYGQHVAGAPRFRTGQRALVFLTPRAGRLFVTGMVQGRFAVQPGAGGTVDTVQPATGGVPLLGKRRVLTQPIPLSTFENRIRAALRSLKRRGR